MSFFCLCFVSVSCPASHRPTLALASTGTANFKLCLELPIPWDLILNHQEKILLDGFLCPAGCDATFKNLGCLCPVYSWSSHCHCEDSLSLQCVAARKYTQCLMREVIKGCFFNERYEWYREIVNTNMSEKLLYVGSYLVRGRHYIIFKTKFEEATVKAAAAQLGGVVIKCSIGLYICWTCGSCDLDAPDGKVQKCAYRSRAFLKAFYRRCGDGNIADTPSVSEAVRIIKLNRFFVFKKCTAAFNYFHL